MDNKKNILVAEDESIIALDITGTLTALGYNVLGVARTKDEVVFKAGKFLPDLILMDIMLDEGSSGIEAAEIIHRENNIPIIYLTAYADNETIKKAQLTDPFGYVLKPFDSKTLYSSIEMAIYKHKMNAKLIERTKELEEEKTKNENLLKNIYPIEIIKELKDKGFIEPREYKNVTLLHTDFQDFTSIASLLPPHKLVSELNDIFNNFDAIIDKYDLEKIKTIGDSYLVGCGFPKADSLHAYKIILAGMEMQNYLKERNEDSIYKWRMRVGIHSGTVITGVVGKTKYAYEVWGSTVNIANYMERIGQPDELNISASTLKLVDNYFDVEPYKEVEIPGEGPMKSYFIKRCKKEIPLYKTEKEFINN